MDIVSDAGTVRRRIVRAQDIDLSTPPERRLAGDLDQMRRAEGGLAGAPERVGPGHVEIAQRDKTEIMRGRGVLQHHLRHQLGAAVGTLGPQGGRLADRVGRILGSIDGGGRRKDEMANAGLDGCGNERARIGRIVFIIGKRVGDRFRYDGRARKMDDRVDVVLGKDPLEQRPVTDIAEVEARLRCDRPAKSSRQTVEHHHRFAAVEQRPYHVAADITCSACYQYGHFPVPCPQHMRDQKRRVRVSEILNQGAVCRHAAAILGGVVKGLPHRSLGFYRLAVSSPKMPRQRLSM